MEYSFDTLFDLVRLPLLRTDARVGYEGSIDKTGGNADWDWCLYEDTRGEFVLFETYGAGCILNFVQHRFKKASDVTFRFYFDDDKEPRFTIKNTEFGEVFPFEAPLATYYFMKAIRVVRSFVPMLFHTYCRITSSEPLLGCTYDGGGWGHVIYQKYPDGITGDSFSPVDDDPFHSSNRYYDLKKRISTRGVSPILCERAVTERKSGFSVPKGKAYCIFESEAKGTVTAIRLSVLGKSIPYGKQSGLFLRITWDGHESPDVFTPIEAFFGNEYHAHEQSYLMLGMAGGTQYIYYPMPYERSGRIELWNGAEDDAYIEFAAVTHTDEWNALYRQGTYGYFRTAPYYERRATAGRDSILCHIQGQHGHLVGACVSGYDRENDLDPQFNAACEGDVRIHIDGSPTPTVESDGSESYVCYGWGFHSAPEENPFTGYDGAGGRVSKPWSMMRTNPFDCQPFLDSLRFGIEAGGCNDEYIEHSGVIFYYGRDGSAWERLCELSPSEGIALTSYFEGDDDDIPVTRVGEYGAERKMTLALPKGTTHLLLRRISDQKLGRQMARVTVDGADVGYPWYYADKNEHKRFLSDEFVIPRRFVWGKDSLTLTLMPVQNWNDFGIEVYAVKGTAE